MSSTDSGLTNRDSPRNVPKKDNFRLRCQRSSSPDTNSPVDCLCLRKGPATGRARPARRAVDAAAHLLQRLPVVGFAAHGSVQGEAGHKARKGLVSAERQPAIQAGWLKPLLSVHSACLKSFSLGIAPCTVSTFWPGRGPKAMRRVHAAACKGLQRPERAARARHAGRRPPGAGRGGCRARSRHPRAAGFSAFRRRTPTLQAAAHPACHRGAGAAARARLLPDPAQSPVAERHGQRQPPRQADADVAGAPTDQGEVTDKSSTNPRAVLQHSADLVGRLFADPPGPDVLLPG